MNEAHAAVEFSTLQGDALQHAFGLCERTAFGAFAEPLNLLFNACFFLVGIAILRIYRSHPDVKNKWIWDLHILTALIFIIGLGSVLFHSFPNRVTEMMDVVPIVIFIVIFFTSIIVRIGKTNLFETIICLLAFVSTTHFFVTQFPNALNDSIGYLSSMAALVMIAVYLNMKRRPSAQQFLLAALLGVVSLFFRSVDNGVCATFPIGTHFLWHCFNAALIYVVMRQLIRNVNREARLARRERAKSF